jgi:hypothetical protein
MAFHKYAAAKLRKAAVSGAEWDGIRRTALSPAPSFANRTAKVLLQEYSPGDFLLSHCTIIASVDTEPVNAPLGQQMVDGFQINRRFADWHVSTPTTKYINNNHDCWERKLLLACFKTFIGAENYVEHIQIPEMSKGKIIDAAARNIGDSIYVDILIATNKRHKALVDAITGGKIGTLSMGCSVEFTTCTKCGNVAEDETHLCPHIRYFKGSEFIDDFGNKRKIAELCGHVSSEPGSVKFIEASWVGNPAFTGAVLRNILSPEEAAAFGDKIQVAFSQAPRQIDQNAMAKAARSMGGSLIHLAQDEGQGQGESGGEAPKAEPEEDPLDKVVRDLADAIREKAVEHVRKEINKDEAAHLRGSPENLNESLIKSAFRHEEWRKVGRFVLGMTRNVEQAKAIVRGLVFFKQGGWPAVFRNSGLTGRQCLAVSRVIDRMTKRSSMAGESRIYNAVITVGGTAPYADVETYLAACRQVLGRPLTGSEAGALLEKGRIFSLGS